VHVPPPHRVCDTAGRWHVHQSKHGPSRGGLWTRDLSRTCAYPNPLRDATLSLRVQDPLHGGGGGPLLGADRSPWERAPWGGQPRCQPQAGWRQPQGGPEDGRRVPARGGSSYTATCPTTGWPSTASGWDPNSHRSRKRTKPLYEERTVALHRSIMEQPQGRCTACCWGKGMPPACPHSRTCASGP
jgi:hypothetical protein